MSKQVSEKSKASKNHAPLSGKSGMPKQGQQNRPTKKSAQGITSKGSENGPNIDSDIDMETETESATASPTLKKSKK